jgi:colanic acid biosynthesis glycosyl transferase WcaI
LQTRVPRLFEKMQTMPPWPHESHLEPLPHSENAFRAKHNLGPNDFCVMYSGNHSPANPLRTLLDAARCFKDVARVKFFFIGGGLGKKEVEAYAAEHKLANIVSLPYQPLADLRYSLSAADVHVVSLGDEMVGIVHPCKIYGAMTVGRPILFLGPRPSHVADILEETPIGRHVAHGDVEAAVDAIQGFLDAKPDELSRMGESAQKVLTERFTQAYLCGKFCDALEKALNFSRPTPTTPAAKSDDPAAASGRSADATTTATAHAATAA